MPLRSGLPSGMRSVDTLAGAAGGFVWASTDGTIARAATETDTITLKKANWRVMLVLLNRRSDHQTRR
jgi:hypothetical protein